MDRLVELAKVIAEKDDEALEIFARLSSQYSDLVIDSRTTGKNLKERFGQPRTFSFSEGSLFGILRINPKSLSVSFDEYEIPVIDIVNAIQCCEDTNGTVPFDKSVLLDAIRALEQWNADEVFEQSQRIKQQLERFRLAHAAKIAESRDTGRANDPHTAAEEIEDTLSGKSLRLFRFLKHRKHATDYDTLRNEVWEKEITNGGIKTALERLSKSLTETGFALTIEHSLERVRLENFSSTSELF